ncbi:MAG: trehalose-phosphatase [Gemmatimonadota bacterium]|nr:trehalose-phosphatase [Gemmatimonadota bacterium]
MALAPSPSDAQLSPAMNALVRALCGRANGALALVSGRSLADLDGFFGEPALAAAGQHGLERRSADGRVTRAETQPERLGDARSRLAALAAQHPGLLVEDKGMSLALHYRAVPRLAGYVHRTMHALVRDLGGTYTLQAGKRVIELRPSSLDKGDAIAAFMQEEPFRGRMPLFIGDDATDERGFARVNALGGHSVKVGVGRTQARWWLRDVDAVRAWLAGSNATSRAP